MDKNTGLVLTKIVRAIKNNLIEKHNFFLDPLVEVEDESTGIKMGEQVELQEWDKGFMAGYAAASWDSVKEITKQLGNKND